MLILLLFSRYVMSNSLQPHGLKHSRLLCLSLSPRICSNSCPLSQWCYLTISFSATRFSFCLQISQHQDLFQWVCSLHQVAKVLELQLQCQSFQWISGLIFFRIVWFDLLEVQETLKSLLQHQNLKALILQCSDFFFFFFFEERNGNPLQCSYLENPMKRRAWLATDYGVAKSQPWLSN